MVVMTMSDEQDTKPMSDEQLEYIESRWSLMTSSVQWITLVSGRTHLANMRALLDEVHRLRAERAKVVELVSKWDSPPYGDDMGGSTGLGYSFAASDLADVLELPEYVPDKGR
jgi:hypothetical protein